MSVESYYSIGSIAIEKSCFRTAAYVGLHRAAVIMIAHASAFRVAKNLARRFKPTRCIRFVLLFNFAV